MYVILFQIKELVMRQKSVFFDCWNTIISFCPKTPYWNVQPLINHCTNLGQVNFEDVYLFLDKVLEQYYRNNYNFEISVEAFLRMAIVRFRIELDCPIELCAHQILDYQDPRPIKGIEEFLTQLEKDGVYYGIISNTIYFGEDTMKIINRLLPNHSFSIFAASKDYGVKKPNPDFFITGVELAQRDIKHAIYIGDAFYQDVYGSYQAGFNNSIWLNHEEKKKETILLHHPEAASASYIEVKGYEELLKKYQNNQLWK